MERDQSEYEKMRLNTKRFRSPIALAGLVISSLGLLKFISLVTEKHAVLSMARRDDIELLELCKAGVANSSPKFRQACVAATSDAITPLVLKAVLAAIRSLFLDFAETFQSPSKLFLLVFFAFSGLALPIVRTLTKIVDVYFGQLQHDAVSDDDCSIVVLDSEPRGRARWRRRPTIAFEEDL